MQRYYRVYSPIMAKVMISLPDELLERVDAEAQRRSTSRSAVLRDFAHAAFADRGSELAIRMRQLNDHAKGHGGDVADVLKASRPE